ncbi:IS3 family transposase (plasmid) [Streptomyces sp. NBC_01591]|uniref:IS3 family transposase n=1 Tax=Streptomyces sp. NBC_01591 TaxID=2975888 RepID=UPI002DD98EC6|nr:IS3 family transposase [Streptomyces sp. NBC_01591]WSD73123.1 IS3 family transposase [Streptomyces sp. NBC_01591]WSD73581.1 IS3 family transposase [Streptomyces sp. NBC_01591]WSD74609.1 IS3 family transposase [Streptomyces sp. NBC_01591]WSD74670.1 IS3 family transposase [Streptomyces sp. NBC_01591]
MVMKHYSAEFKADAVALYESRPEATIKQVAADLGINPETLRNWIRVAGSGCPRGRRSTAPSSAPVVPSALEAEVAALRRENAELKKEREILRKAARYFGGGDGLVNRCQFVEDHQRRYGVKRLCRVLGLARSTFYYWRRTASLRAARQAADARLATLIRTVHRASDGTYGVPRITAELRDGGEVVNHKRVARVMKAIGLAGLRLRRRHRTTVPDLTVAKVPALIGRDFTATDVNTKYVGDITYLPLSGGTFRYLATVIDLASRRLAGWAIADHMRADLVIDALHAAERTRGNLTGAIFHSDHGAQYCSRAFADACREAGVTQSMSAVGSSADNALAESFNATCKRETLQGRRAWDTEHEAHLDLLRWLHRYNTVRRHSRLGHRSPIAYERALRTTSTTLAESA